MSKFYDYYLNRINNAKSNDEILSIINFIYQDGFDDGWLDTPDWCKKFREYCDG